MGKYRTGIYILIYLQCLCTDQGMCKTCGLLLDIVRELSDSVCETKVSMCECDYVKWNMVPDNTGCDTQHSRRMVTPWHTETWSTPCYPSGSRLCYLQQTRNLVASEVTLALFPLVVGNLDSPHPSYWPTCLATCPSPRSDWLWQGHVHPAATYLTPHTTLMSGISLCGPRGCARRNSIITGFCLSWASKGYIIWCAGAHCPRHHSRSIALNHSFHW